MPAGISAATIAGLALETVSGTYTAPTKFFPLVSESLNYQQDTQWRKVLRGQVDAFGAIPGNAHTEGDISIEALDDVVPYFLDAARGALVATGAGPKTYTFTPNANAIPAKTLSLTIVRNGIVFGYTGVVVSSYTFTLNNGTLMFNASLVGADEAVQSSPTAVWPTSVPYGTGMYSFEIPSGTPVTDADSFEFQVDDNASPQYRLRSGGFRGATFVAFGDRSSSIKTERDFVARTEYDAYKALTAQAIKFAAVNGTASITINATTAIKDTYTVNEGGTRNRNNSDRAPRTEDAAWWLRRGQETDLRRSPPAAHHDEDGDPRPGAEGCTGRDRDDEPEGDRVRLSEVHRRPQPLR
jgi:hypothetical protein